MFSGTTIKDTWTKLRGWWNQGREVGMAGVGGDMGEKGRQLYLNNNKFFLKIVNRYTLYYVYFANFLNWRKRKSIKNEK